LPIDKEIFKFDTAEVARKLLGHFLCRETGEGLISGMIVETEAYLSENDSACHASRGQTKGNAVMFGPPGRAYIYFIYGNYHCFNVVTAPAGKGEAVLIRAVEPVEGLNYMYKNRKSNCDLKNLTNGPGKICQAFAIDRSLNGHDLQQKPLYLMESKRPVKKPLIDCTPRIGISSAKDKYLRFIIKDNDYLSR